MSGWISPTGPVRTDGWQASRHLEQLSVSFGDVRFETGISGTFGSHEFTLVQFEGWRDMPADETESFRHPSGDGLLSSAAQMGARVLTLTGHLNADSIAAADEGRDRLMSASGLLVVDERSRILTREVSARRIGLRWSQLLPNRLQFTLTLIADDPLIYATGVKDLSNGANVLVNRGDRTAWPVLEVSGTGALTIAHAGGSYSLTETPSNQTRVVDLRNGDVWNGNVRMFGVESGPAPRVAPGGGSWTVSGVGAGSVRVRRFEAWS